MVPYHPDRRLVLETHDNQRRQNIYNWLAAPDYESKHLNAAREGEKHTGSWFLLGESSHERKSQPKSLLWLHGNGMFSACLIITASKHTQEYFKGGHGESTEIRLAHFSVCEYLSRNRSAPTASCRAITATRNSLMRSLPRRAWPTCYISTSTMQTEIYAYPIIHHIHMRRNTGLAIFNLITIAMGLCVD
jgi:hypothetical protein